MMVMNGRNMFFDNDINFQEYASFISHELCYWLPSHMYNFTHTTGMAPLKVIKNPSNGPRVYTFGRMDGAYIYTSQFYVHPYKRRKMSSSLFRVAMQRR